MKQETAMKAADRALHMTATAQVLARYIAAASQAGLDREQVNRALAEICAQTVVSEFWVSDERGAIEFSSADAQGFRFPLDPEAGTQAAPFASLLSGETSVVAQEPQPREQDNRTFQYVGVAGIDKPRVVQVGIAIADN